MGNGGGKNVGRYGSWAEAMLIVPSEMTSRDRLLLVVRGLMVSTRRRIWFMQKPLAIHLVTGIQTSDTLTMERENCRGLNHPLT